MKVKINPSFPIIPGFGGLNRIALLEDGWEPGMVLHAKPWFESGMLHVSWGEEEYQYRIVYKHEIEIVEND